MPTTKRIMVERIQKKLQGGTIATNARVGYNEIVYELNAVFSKLFRAQAFEGFKDGASVPDGALIATYEDTPIDRRDKGKSYVTLPVSPMVLPGGIGIFDVYPSGRPDDWYIPVRPGLTYTVTGNKLINPLGRRTYSSDRNRIIFNSDIVGDGVTDVDIQLCVSDITSLDDNDILPIPADLEADAVIAVLQVFGLESPVTRADDKAASPTKADVK